MRWLLWQLYRFWIGCRESDCTHYWTRSSRLSIPVWHEIVHRHFLELAEWPHYGMVTEAGKRWAKRHGAYQYAEER